MDNESNQTRKATGMIKKGKAVKPILKTSEGYSKEEETVKNGMGNER